MFKLQIERAKSDGSDNKLNTVPIWPQIGIKRPYHLRKIIMFSPFFVVNIIYTVVVMIRYITFMYAVQFNEAMKWLWNAFFVMDVAVYDPPRCQTLEVRVTHLVNQTVIS